MAKAEYEIAGLTFLYEEGREPAGAKRVIRDQNQAVSQGSESIQKIAQAPLNKLGTAETKTVETAPPKRTRRRTRKTKE